MAVNTGTQHGRRTELAQFLRARRAGITPADAGLPPGPRRRTPGLRREEVAQLAGVGVTWYTWLEQGRRINASSQVLDAVARTLRLDEVERSHLYSLAEVPVPADHRSEDFAPLRDLPPEMRGILDALDPLPACVYNCRMDLLAWNGQYVALFPGMALVDPYDGTCSRSCNVIWRSFTIPGCCHTYGDRETELRQLVARLRGAYGRHVGERSWTLFIADLRAESAEFARMWDRQEVADPGPHVKQVRHPAYGDIPVSATSLDIHGTADARLVVYSPLDEGAAERLAKARAMEDPVIGCPIHARKLSEIVAMAGTGAPGRGRG